MIKSALERPRIEKTFISPSTRFRDAVIGDRCEVLDDTELECVVLGNYSYIGERCMIADAEIGRFCAIAAHVRIGAPNHPMERASQHRFTYCPEYYFADAVRDATFFEARRAARASIGNDIWIGHGVVVLPGVQVGDGAVLAAGAVVTREVAPYSVAGGIPARKIRDRFKPGIAEQLRDIAWWNWPEQTLRARLVDFQCLEVEEFCAKWGRS